MKKTKVCTKCGKRKNLECFYAAKLGKCGKKARCARCCAAYAASRLKTTVAAQRLWRAANSDRLRAYRRSYYATHKAEVLRRGALWRAANPDKVRAVAAKWASDPAYRERARMRSRAWYEANREYAIFRDYQNQILRGER